MATGRAGRSPVPPPAPPGTRWEAVPEVGWRLARPGERCRFGRPSCKAPAVAALERGVRCVSWWPYCAAHMYGRWIENGQVMWWRLVDDPVDLEDPVDGPLEGPAGAGEGGDG